VVNWKILINAAGSLKTMSLILQLERPLDESYVRNIITKSVGVIRPSVQRLNVHEDGIPFAVFLWSQCFFAITYNEGFGAHVAEYASRTGDMRRINRDDDKILDAKVISAVCDFIMFRPAAVIDIHRQAAYAVGMGSYAEAGTVLNAFGKEIYRNDAARIQRIATFTRDARGMPEIYEVER
jgi:hypothetical protein